MSTPDAVVVGAGPNGLAAAITLARAGRSVHVLERADAVGGAARTAETTLPGLRHDLGSAVHPFGVTSPAFTAWPLAAHGLRWLHPPTPLAHPLDGAPAATLAADLDATADALGADADAWRFLTGPATRDLGRLAPDVLGPLLRWPASPVALARFGVRGLPPAAWPARALRTDAARALWAGLAAHAALPFGAPATSAPALLLAAMGQRVGWPFPRGGAGALADALAAYLTSLGGRVTTGVEVHDLRDLPPAPVRLLDVTPATFLRLAGPERLPAGYVRALRRYRPGEGVVKLDLAVEGGVPWSDPAVHAAGTVHLGGRFEAIRTAEADVAAGRLPAEPYVLVAQAGRFDASRRAGDLEPVWAYAHLPRRRVGDGAAVRTLAARIVDQLERAAPGLRARVRAERTWGPVDLAGDNPNLVGGDVANGAPTLRQLVVRPNLARVPYATPLPGTYLCSAATPPGPGVHGMAGVRAAEAALRWDSARTASGAPGTRAARPPR